MRSFLLSVALSAGVSGSANFDTTYLASITGLSIASDEYVEEFSIDTWGVRLLAVCRIPPGWTITAGGSAAQDGIMSGGGNHNVTFLDRARLDQLHGLVLLRLSGPIRMEEVRSSSAIVPATFSGMVRVGTYGSDKSRELRLDHTNVSLTPAIACPSM